MLHAARSLASRAKAAVQSITDRRHREFHAQRRVTDPATRIEMADRFAATLPNCAQPGAGDDALSVDGFAPVAGLLTPPQIAEIHAYFADKLAHDMRRPHLGKFTAANVPAETHFAEYDQRDVLDAPHLLAVANNPGVLEAVEAYLGAQPVIGALRVWWSTPTPSGLPEASEFFHRDVDDLRFAKLFIYLTDVDEESGPHVFVKGSHRRDVLTAIRRYSDEEVFAVFGDADMQRFTGPAGTAFLEATYGLHRGIPPVSKPRLVFQPLYTMRPVMYGPRRPLRARRIAEAGLDWRVNRVFLA